MFCKNLVQAREKSGLTQEEVAKKIGCTQTAISYFEKGVKTPSLSIVMTLAEIYGVSLDYLCFDK